MIAMMTSRLDLSRVPDRPKPSSPWSPGAAAAGACASSSSFPRRIPNQLELSLSIMQEETERYVAFPPKLPFVSRGIFAHAGEVIDFLKRRDGVYFCPINVANRYAFNLLHVLTVAYQTCPIPGRHYPTILHDEGEERRRRRDMLKEYEIWDPTALGLQEAANDQELQEAEAAAGDRYRHRPRGQNPDRAEYEKLSDAFKDLKTTNSP
ncbi:hypothetical protein Fcan01_22315 [Folsomia candida]|uniref:Uncharacterized protein n=1 Tax=Folsomia candida TaxID=158441 RepID=A0A226DDE4_FOLCA|nr:hypothetical protein Fcan01_22315 [Folsomia candida]